MEVNQNERDSSNYNSSSINHRGNFKNSRRIIRKQVIEKRKEVKPCSALKLNGKRKIKNKGKAGEKYVKHNNQSLKSRIRKKYYPKIYN